MSRLKELIDQFCSDGVEYKKLGEVVSLERGKRVVRKQLSETEGYPVYQNSLTPLGYYYQSNYPKDSTFIIVAGAAGEIGYSDKDFWAADDCFVIVCPEHVSSRYIYHFLLNRQQSLYSKVRKASIPRLPRQAIDNIKIPVPPMAVQREIVRILDDYSARTAELVKELEVELEARKKQYEFYRDQLLRFDNVRGRRIADLQWKTLGDITRVFSSARVHKKDWTDSGVSFLRSSDLISKYNGVANPRGKAYISYELYEKLSVKSGKVRKGDLLITGGGTIGIPYIVSNDEPIYMKDADVICIQKSEKIKSKFLYHYFLSTKFRNYLNNITHNATIAHYTISQIEKTPVPVPPLAEQERIVAILDRFNVLCNDLTSGLPAEIAARQKQYEYYRDKLLSFKELEA